MARETVVQYTSDISGKPIADDKLAVEIRIKWPSDGRKGSVVLDALESEVKDWIAKGRREKPRGRAPSKKK
jgi:hypothetical protein